MARLVVFLSFLIGLALILSMGGYQKYTAKNVYFNFAQAEKKHAEDVLLAHEASLANQPQHEEAVVEEAAAPALVEIVIPLDTEELKNGHQIYQNKGKCTTCHGKNGEGRKSQQAPRLAGQFDWYLKDQLINMKNKVRENKVMDPYLKTLTEKDFNDVAIYLSKLPWKK